MKTKLGLIPKNKGFGFYLLDPFDPTKITENYDFEYKKEGIYHNFYYTSTDHKIPPYLIDKNFCHYFIVDGFSPNLNKELHVGHLRNFILAISISRILDCKTVCLLGCSLGIKENSLSNIRSLFDEFGYNPKIYLDCLLPKVEVPMEDGSGDKLGCKVLKDKDVVLITSDGRKTYPYYDLLFREQEQVDYYITGSEQKDHFESLGLGSKHLPIGLVVDSTGKKIKSREGNPVLMEELILQVGDKLNLKEKDSERKLSWNILCGKLLSVSREKNVKFDLEEWTNTNSPGMYISYTYARFKSLNLGYPSYTSVAPNWEEDSELISHCSFSTYWFEFSKSRKDPVLYLEYVVDLCKILNNYYNRKKMNEYGFSTINELSKSLYLLENSLYYLGMHKIDRI